MLTLAIREDEREALELHGLADLLEHDAPAEIHDHELGGEEEAPPQ
jgi:hypothetical protein